MHTQLSRQRRCIVVATIFKFYKEVAVTDIIASDPESTTLYTRNPPEYTPPHGIMCCFQK